MISSLLITHGQMRARCLVAWGIHPQRWPLTKMWPQGVLTILYKGLGATPIHILSRIGVDMTLVSTIPDEDLSLLVAWVAKGVTITIHPRSLTWTLKNDDWMTNFLLGRLPFRGYFKVPRCMIRQSLLLEAVSFPWKWQVLLGRCAYGFSSCQPLWGGHEAFSRN